MYHINYQFDKAINQFNKYIKLSKPYNSTENIDSIISICNYAKNVIKDSLNTDITNIESINNIKIFGQNPYISADEDFIYFTRKDSKEKETIYYSHKQLSGWAEPRILKIDKSIKKNPLSIAGLSPNGKQLFLTITEGIKSNIYAGELKDGACLNIVKLNQAINSNYWEGDVSLSLDSTSFYFSSKRIGGYGGKDIYKVSRNKNGDFSNPINLGSEINTKYDETDPFIYYDNKTLYFSSNGHQTIGGFDIYRTINTQKNFWSKPINIGYPINSTSDDFNFTMSRDGNTAYYSTNIIDENGNYNIRNITLNKGINYSVIKGEILTEDSLFSPDFRIIIIDKETNRGIKNIYNPNSSTGKYLMILPPNKKYDMIIEAEGYLPHILNIHIPDQMSFYELYQKISLSKIKANSNKEANGQKITVTNTFYDINNSNEVDNIHIDTIYYKDYSKLLSLIEELIETTDTVALEELDRLSQSIINNVNESNNTLIAKNYNDLINIIEKAIETTDILVLEQLDKEAKYDDEISNNLEIDFKNSKLSNRKYITNLNIFFTPDSYVIDNKFGKDFERLVKLVKENKYLGIEITGYSDTQGNKEDNYALSNKRVISVLNTFVSRGIQPYRNVLRHFGESKFAEEETTKEKQFNRRVEIKIFKIINR